jgi:hypothetical protein
MKVRTVFTGFDAKGRSFFVQDAKIGGTPIPGIGEFAFLWNASQSGGQDPIWTDSERCGSTHEEDQQRRLRSPEGNAQFF